MDRTRKLTRTEASSSFLIFMAVVVLAMAVLLSFYYNSRRRSSDQNDAAVLSEPKQRPTPPNKPMKFTFTELSTATAGFNEVEILSNDAKGVYYRGKLAKGCHVEIKRFAPQFLASVGPEWRRLINEFSEVSKLWHPNLVPVRGWCEDRREAIVVYELLPNGSLDRWLFDVGVLSWSRWLKVLRDVAEGVAFFYSKELVHKNLKPSSSST